MLIFTMVIPRMSGWVFSCFARRVEISERNSELLRAELTVNIQLVFMAGLCRCYFFSSLLKKGVYFQLSGNNVMWLTSVIIPCASHRQERQNWQILPVQTAEKPGGNPVLEQTGRSWAALQVPSEVWEGFVCTWSFFKQKCSKMQPETPRQVLAWAWHLLCAVLQLRHWSCQFLIINMKGGEIKTQPEILSCLTIPGFFFFFYYYYFVISY